MTNEERKKFLGSYQNSMQRLERISAEIDEIQIMKTGIFRMGRLICGSDLAECAAELDGLERKLKKECRNAEQQLENVPGVIESLEDMRERNVLFYRYIKGLTWWEIAEKMSYSERGVQGIHSKALEHLNTPQSAQP